MKMRAARTGATRSTATRRGTTSRWGQWSPNRRKTPLLARPTVVVYLCCGFLRPGSSMRAAKAVPAAGHVAGHTGRRALTQAEGLLADTLFLEEGVHSHTPWHPSS